jgi:hypothetical protein
MTFATDRQDSLVDGKTWVTHDAQIELPRNIEFGCQEISAKAGTWSHAIALLVLYSISRAEFEHPTTFARARAILRRGEWRLSLPENPFMHSRIRAGADRARFLPESIESPGVEHG